MKKPPTQQQARQRMNQDTNAPYLSVAELSQAVKRTVETAFDYVRVRGEISQPRIPGSGHLYFTLKDDKHALSAVMWKGMASQLSITPEEGLDVICTGKMTTFGGQSRYQIVVQDIEIAGEGALLKQLEERKRRLSQEGLFDQSRKQSLPFLPRVIGVVTSPTGAVIRDILHRLSERFGVHVLIWGVAVQGQGAAEQIAAAIDGFNHPDTHNRLGRPDLLIVARGGGSLEDLWAFNEEIVARAVARSQIPLISAVGHETDTTLIDYVSDLRAPTPTAAAELATPVKRDIIARIEDNDTRMRRAVIRRYETADQMLRATARGLLHPADQIGRQGQRLDMVWASLDSQLLKITSHHSARLAQVTHRLISPAHKIASSAERVNRADEQLGRHVQHAAERASRRLGEMDRLLQANSFERVLDRGFALVTNADGVAVKKSSEAAKGAEVTLTFADAKRAARLDPDASVTGGGSVPPAPKPAVPSSDKKRTPVSASTQTELF